MAAGSAMFSVSNFVHPLLSVILTMYVPTHKFDIEEEVAPVDQENV